MKILVIGETCVDKFVYGSVTRVCPEAPVPVFVPIGSNKTTLGMASNVQRNILAIRQSYRADIVTNQDMPIKTRYVEQKSNHMIMRIDENDVVHEKFSAKDIKFEKYDAIVVSDYDKGFISEADLLNISQRHPLTFLDTKKPLGDYFVNFSFIKINEPEYQSIPNPRSFISNTINKKLIVTMSEKGCRYNGVNYPPKEISHVMDISGAGDTFLAGLVCKYLETKDIEQAILFANECAGKVVHKKGVSTI